ncbi:MAG: hypothetical protein IJ191_07495 [Treponema sp.]|nr:hypothetical protein [Treponema sp.]
MKKLFIGICAMSAVLCAGCFTTIIATATLGDVSGVSLEQTLSKLHNMRYVDREKKVRSWLESGGRYKEGRSGSDGDNFLIAETYVRPCLFTDEMAEYGYYCFDWNARISQGLIVKSLGDVDTTATLYIFDSNGELVQRVKGTAFSKTIYNSVITVNTEKELSEACQEMIDKAGKNAASINQKLEAAGIITAEKERAALEKIAAYFK